MRNNLRIGKQVFTLLMCLLFLNGYSQNSITLKFVPAKDSSFQYVGRYLKTSNATVKFALPGVSVYGAFEGTYLDIVVKDNGTGTATTTNYLAVLVDSSAPYVIKLNPTDTIYRVSSTLAAGLHNLQIVKRTESMVGIVEFKGIRILQNSGVAKYSNLPASKILCIGNSITCGYGNDTSIAGNANTGFTSKHEDNYNSYGQIAARALHAQYMAFAYSGRGLYKNISGSTTGVIPQIFDRVFPDDSTYVWNHALYVPDWITVNLGTNDFTSETNGQGMIDSLTFVNKYLAFVARLKQLYPSAQIVLLVGPMMTDAYPANGKQWTRIQAYVRSVVQQEKQNGNTRINYLAFEPQSAPYGEDFHPSIKTHQLMADELTALIKTSIEGVEDARVSRGALLVFPNPANEYLTVKNMNRNFPLMIYDVRGNLLMTKTITSEEMKLDLGKFSKGTYILRNNKAGSSFIIE